MMIRRICFSILILLPALPAYAGHGTIRETDTEIFVEYYGDDDDKQAIKAVKEEQQKETAKQEKTVEVIKSKIEKNAARAAEHRKDEE